MMLLTQDQALRIALVSRKMDSSSADGGANRGQPVRRVHGKAHVTKDRLLFSRPRKQPFRTICLVSGSNPIMAMLVITQEGPPSGRPAFSAAVRSVEPPRAGQVIQFGNEFPLGVLHEDDRPADEGGHVTGAAAAGKPDLGMVVVADDGGVQVAVDDRSGRPP